MGVLLAYTSYPLEDGILPTFTILSKDFLVEYIFEKSLKIIKKQYIFTKGRQIHGPGTSWAGRELGGALANNTTNNQQTNTQK